jgi:hypothetical protein
LLQEMRDTMDRAGKIWFATGHLRPLLTNCWSLELLYPVFYLQGLVLTIHNILIYIPP